MGDLGCFFRFEIKGCLERSVVFDPIVLKGTLELKRRGKEGMEILVCALPGPLTIRGCRQFQFLKLGDGAQALVT